MAEARDFLKGLTPATARLFETVSCLDCIKGLYLCGGTAQSLMMNHRLSEDLDFELLGIAKNRPELQTSQIIKEIETAFPQTRREILGTNHFLLFVEDSVKLSFFRPKYAVPHLSRGFVHNNLVTPDLQDLLGMKLYTITVRDAFRDYYDIYCLLRSGYDLKEGVRYACAFSRHTIHSKDIYSRLLFCEGYPAMNDFYRMKPVYNIRPEDIVQQVKTCLENY